jgi:sugar lactone lactonase YvrE
MKSLFKFLRRLGLVLAVLLVLILVVLRLRYGGGKLYPDTSGKAELPTAALVSFFQYDEPIGNVAASRDTGSSTRVFFTVHPESHPTGFKLLEIKNGKAVPYPSAEDQKLFNTVLGVFCDGQNRLWTIDHGNHATQAVKLLAFDLKTNRLVEEYTFPKSVAETGSFFNDLSVSPDGKYVFIADVSFWRKSPSLVVYDVEKKQSRSLLDGHPSVTSQRYVPVNQIKKMRFVGGLLDLMPGIDGLDVDRQNKYVYYAAMSHEGLYRIPVAACVNFSLSPAEIAAKVERVSSKPLSDGIRLDSLGNVLITDIEHQGIARVSPEGKLSTLIRDSRIRWADGLSLAGDGYWYLADSDIPDQMLQSKAHIAAHRPYYIFRFKN